MSRAGAPVVGGLGPGLCAGAGDGVPRGDFGAELTMSDPPSSSPRENDETLSAASLPMPSPVDHTAGDTISTTSGDAAAGAVISAGVPAAGRLIAAPASSLMVLLTSHELSSAGSAPPGLPLAGPAATTGRPAPGIGTTEIVAYAAAVVASTAASAAAAPASAPSTPSSPTLLSSQELRPEASRDPTTLGLAAGGNGLAEGRSISCGVVLRSAGAAEPASSPLAAAKERPSSAAVRAAPTG